MVLRYRHPYADKRRPLAFLPDLLTPHFIPDAGIVQVARDLGSGLASQAEFDFMALGTSATAAAAGDTALGAEISTSGGSRVATTATNQTTNFTDDTVRFSATYTFTGTLGINEFGIFTLSSAGVMLLRQVYAAVLNVVSTDVLTQTVDVISSDSVVASDSTITRAGIVDGNKLITTDLAGGGAMSHIGFGTGTTAVADTQTALVTETFSNGFGTGGVRFAATVALATTTITNDTVRLTKTISVTGTVALAEQGIFNASSGGTMYLRTKFAAVLNLVNTDTYNVTHDYVITRV